MSFKNRPVARGLTYVDDGNLGSHCDGFRVVFLEIRIDKKDVRSKLRLYYSGFDEGYQR